MRIFLSLLLALFVHQGASAQDKVRRIVAFGDSLSAGYLLQAKDAFPSQLERLLRAKGHHVSVENAGVSGDTASGGLARLDWSVGEGVEAVILELGANDALRGLDPAITEKALDEMITKLKARGIKVLLAGMYAPRNNGEAYAKAFDAIYPRLSQKHGIALYPFFLAGVQGQPALNLSDGMHPNAAGVGKIAENMLPEVEKLLGAR
jgi:acyl-CoA thioesterase I